MPDKKNAACESVREMIELANVVGGIAAEKHMVANISGKDHPQYEAMLLIASAYGCTPRTTEVRPLKGGGVEAYMAKAELVDSAGNVVGRGYGMCSRAEPRWKSQPSYAVLAMAQTRACGRAIRSVFGHIMRLAGLSPCAAEEMDGVVGDHATAPAAAPRPSAAPRQQARPAAAPSNGSSGIMMKFGRSKGKAIDDPSVPMDDLAWMRDAIAKSIDDPAKANWRASNVTMLEALDGEISRRRGGVPDVDSGEEVSVFDGGAPDSGDDDWSGDDIPF